MTTGAKKMVAVEDLTIGMFVSSLDMPIAETPFPLQGFYIRRKEEILELSKYCNYVMVNITKSRVAKVLNNTMQFEVMDIPKALTNPVGFKVDYKRRTSKKMRPEQKWRVKRLLVLLLTSAVAFYYFR